MEGRIEIYVDGRSFEVDPEEKISHYSHHIYIVLKPNRNDIHEWQIERDEI